jgi:CDP-paratose 2-epimerase
MKWLITGGAGFIGTNSVLNLISRGEQVVVIDDLSRPGVKENAKEILSIAGIEINRIDITDFELTNQFLDRQGPFDVLLNLAGQVSLMESIKNPIRDFTVNAFAPLNLLEYVRKYSPDTLIINMSSNKIYGSLDKIGFEEKATRYEVASKELSRGFSEETPLDFHGPYGCSKGSADQYFNDYHRIYGLKCVSLRQSAVYGPFQKPMSDQGWLAFMVQEAIEGREIHLNGVGKQVRDLLHVDDLINLFFTLSRCDSLLGKTSFNVGGGFENQISILELFELLKQRYNLETLYKSGQMRPGDQKYFVSDNTLITKLTSWKPEISINEGLDRLINNR